MPDSCRRRLVPILALVLLLPGAGSAQTISTVAGGGPPDGAPVLEVSLTSPSALLRDAAGSTYVATQRQVFRIDAAGRIFLLAGNGGDGISSDGGAATATQVRHARDIARDPAGNLFIADSVGHRVWRVDAVTGVISTVAGTGVAGYSGDGGLASAAQLHEPSGVVLDAAGGLLIADQRNHRVRRVDPASGAISTIAGNGSPGFSGDDGPATGARLFQPSGMAIDAAGRLLIADQWNHRIRRVDPASGKITTVAGNGSEVFSGDDGPATEAGLRQPHGVALDAAGHLFIADTFNRRIRRVDALTGRITTVAGTGSPGYAGDGGPARDALLNNPSDVTFDPISGDLYIADSGNQRIRRVAALRGAIESVAGNGSVSFSGDAGPAVAAQFWYPAGVALDAAGRLLIADQYNHLVRRVDPLSGAITTIAGTGAGGFSGDGGPAALAQLNGPSGLAFDAAGNLFIADYSNNRVRRVDAVTGEISTVAGNGLFGDPASGNGRLATAGPVIQPAAVAFDAAGTLFIAQDAGAIRRVDTATGILTTVAGVSGSDVALDAAGNLFVADERSHRIRRVDAVTGAVTTVAGTGVLGFSGDGGPATAARLAYPVGLALDAAGNLYISDKDNQRIRRVDAATGTIDSVAGNGAYGLLGDGGPAHSARIALPRGLALGAGRLFIADYFNHRVRSVALCDPADRDCDGVPDAQDKCPWFPGDDQGADADGDGRGDACECGDQNGDGFNTASDLVAINSAIFNPALVTPLCDANNDRRCDVGDIVAVSLEIFSPGSTSTCERQPVPGP